MHVSSQVAFLLPPQLEIDFRCRVGRSSCAWASSKLQIGNRKSLKPFRVPVRMFQAAFTGVLKKFVDWREQDAGTVHVHAHGEIEFVVEEMDVAVAEHAEKPPGCIQIFSIKNSVFDRETGRRITSDAVAAAGDDRVQNVGKRSKDGNGKDVAIRDPQFSSAAHQPGIAPDTGEIITSVQLPLRAL